VAEARADWFFTPFIGTTFGTQTSFVLPEAGAGSGAQLIFGGSAALLSRGIFGVEADYGYAPRFFERDNRAGLTSGSNVNTLSGSAIFAVPLSVTRESLRPYVTGGLGLMHAAAKDTNFDITTFDANFVGFNVGGGAIGLISPRTGFRFEIRHFRSVQNALNALTGESSARLSFWRATIGVVIRIAN
jgi:opacity protein-like surface antigen